jgi:tRNA(Ile)-lysidine synthase
VRHRLASLLGVVQATIRTNAMLEPGMRVLIAVSGGPDSTGLVLCLAALRRKLRIEPVAAHVNHRLRGRAADHDEQCAAASAATLGVPFVRTELAPVLQGGGNLEARARRLRYAALHALAAAHGCARIATGHTLDDQAETVLMRLVRGSGHRGLQAIRPRRRDGVIRPLIDCPRAALAAVVGEAGLAVAHDETNADPRFLRTHIRHRVLPLLKELNPAIARACGNLAAAARAERWIVSAWADAEVAAAAGGGALRLTALCALEPALRPLVLRRWLVRAGVAERALTTRHTRAVLDLAHRERGRAEAHLPGGWVVRRERAAIIVERGTAVGRPGVGAHTPGAAMRTRNGGF